MKKLDSDRTRKHSWERRVEAAASYLIAGTAKGAERLCGISYRTILDWKKQPWWEDAMAEARKAFSGKIEAHLNAILEEGLGAILDRIKHGDSKLQKDGTIIKVPAPLSAIGVATGIVFDKSRLLAGEPTSISSKGNKSTKEQLEEAKAALHKYGEQLFHPQDGDDNGLLEEKAKDRAKKNENLH